MSAKSSGLKPKGNVWAKSFLFSLLDVFAITAWGALLLKYWQTGSLNLLIHPDYFWLAIVTAVVLVLLGTLKAIQLLLTLSQRLSPRGKARNRAKLPSPVVSGHYSLFPPGWSAALLLATAILGFMVTPKVFASQTANQRGVADAITMTRSQPQAFHSSQRPEDRSLIDWVRTLNVYPEPDGYTGQKVKVQGFVVYPNEPPLPDQYILISRFVITCCAADAYPVGLPVKLDQDRKNYAPDTWLEIEGQMITETLAGKRQLTIQASSLKNIPQPENPYYY